MSRETVHAADEVFIGFTRALRVAGLAVSVDRAANFLHAATLVGLDHPVAVFGAGRATLCSSPEDLDVFGRVFTAWFDASGDLPGHPQDPDPQRVQAALPAELSDAHTDDGDPDEVAARASEVEVLSRRDVATLDAGEKALIDAMIGSLRPHMPRRRSNRREPARRGQVDVGHTLRSSLRRMGEPARVEHRERGSTERRVVLLIDVSASMGPYIEAVMRLAHRVAREGQHGRRHVEVFTLGTRLTRVTAALRTTDPARGLVQAGEQVPDWSGGTRLGETLGAFLDRWGARGMARGAVVVIFSDGWERGDAVGLGEQMSRLSRLARRVVWVNPHRGKDGYLPVQRGIAVALPHCDEFVAGHSLQAFREVLEVIARA